MDGGDWWIAAWDADPLILPLFFTFLCPTVRLLVAYLEPAAPTSHWLEIKPSFTSSTQKCIEMAWLFQIKHRISLSFRDIHTMTWKLLSFWGLGLVLVGYNGKFMTLLSLRGLILGTQQGCVVMTRRSGVDGGMEGCFVVRPVLLGFGWLCVLHDIRRHLD